MQEKEGSGSPSRTDKQLFFVSQGQNWCSKGRRRAEDLQLLTDPHAPGEICQDVVLCRWAEFLGYRNATQPLLGCCGYAAVTWPLSLRSRYLAVVVTQPLPGCCRCYIPSLTVFHASLRGSGRTFPVQTLNPKLLTPDPKPQILKGSRQAYPKP